MMAIIRQADDNTFHEFPDSTPEAVIWRAMNNYNATQRSALQTLMTLPIDAFTGHRMGLAKRAEWAALQGKATANNDIDAQRHADWSRQMALAFGPRNAARIGELHEIEGWIGDMLNPAKPYDPSAARMDRHNNAVGVNSARAGRPYALDDLQLSRSRPAKNAPAGLGDYDPYRTRTRGSGR